MKPYRENGSHIGQINSCNLVPEVGINLPTYLLNWPPHTSQTLPHSTLYELPIGKSSKNIKIRIFPLNVKNHYIVKIYVLTMAALFWTIFQGKTLLKTPVMGRP